MNLPPHLGRPRQGLALLAALFIIIVLAILGSTMVSSVTLHSQSTRNEYESIRIQQVAEAGLAHAVGLFHVQLADDPVNDLIKGADLVYGTADDGVMTGFGIGSADEVPTAGVLLGSDRYYLKITDDPGDPTASLSVDGNNRLMVSCRAVAPSGATTELRAIVARDAAPSYALSLGGTVNITSNFTFNGNCGQVYVVGSFSPTSAAPNSVKGWLTTTPTAIPATFKGAPKTTNVAVTPIPALGYAQACPATLTATRYATSQTFDVTAISAGVHCVTGDITIIGTSVTTKALTFIATGSIRSLGSTIKPKWKAAHPSGYAVVAGGDLQLTGTTDITGAVFCDGQLDLQNASTVNGYVYCQGNAAHAGTNWVATNTISSTAKITNACGSTPGLIGVWKEVAWYPVIGN